MKQGRYSNRIRAVFGKDEVQPALEDGGGCRSFPVPCTQASHDRQTRVGGN